MKNPTEDIRIDFNNYVIKRTKILQNHLIDGVPDYAFDLDSMLNRKIQSMPGIYSIAKALASQYIPRERQRINMTGMRVTPKQFGDIYQVTKECAQILGIGMPSVFIDPDPGQINAYTIASEDADPIIVIQSSLVERMTLQELKSVIGHECGHIHNNHGIYNLAASMILTGSTVAIPAFRALLPLLTLPIQLALSEWSRAAEVTCDRAGIICCGESISTESVHAKFMAGGLLNRSDFDSEEAIRQYDAVKETPAKLQEYFYDHPISIRRIIVAREFAKSEVFYDWRPEKEKPDIELMSKKQLDQTCRKYISVIRNEKRKEENK